MNTKNLISALALYLVSTGVSFAAFSYLDKPSVAQTSVVANEEGSLQIDPSEPKTQACPLNGQLFTKTEENVYKDLRPLTVMIENHVEARPQSGISTADIVYEAVAEGGVTRFLGVFLCDAVSSDTILAPVRSARTYFLDWASEYGKFPLYAHIGGANCSAPKDEAGNRVGPCMTAKKAQAIEQIASYGWRMANDIDGMSIGLPVYRRDSARLGVGRPLATEHTVVSSTQRLWNEANKRGWTNEDPDGNDWQDFFTPWNFQDPDEKVTPGSVTTISHDFWEGYQDFSIRWEYDVATNTYKRFTANQPHLDLNNNQQVAVSNVIVFFTKEQTSVDDLKHVLYTTIGTGDALIFSNGQVTEATWSKTTRTSRTQFVNENGKDIAFAPGKIWISVVDTSTEINY